MKTKPTDAKGPPVVKAWKAALPIAVAIVLGLALPTHAQTISLASAPPVVVKTVPVAGAMDVDPGLAEIKVTYSKSMQDGSWSWSTWGEENFPETTGKPRYLKDGRTCVLPVRLQPKKFYAIWLNSNKFKNFKDASGQPAVPYLLTFFTGGAERGGAYSSRLTTNTRPAEWLKEEKIDLDKVNVQEAPLTQVVIDDLEADGTIRFRNVERSVNRGDAAQTKLQFINSDIVELQRLFDQQGNAIPFTAVHTDRIFRYSATLPNPVPPGAELIHGSEGIMRNVVDQDAEPGTFTYRFTHSPDSGVTTRRVEVHRLPPGAKLLELSSDATKRELNGRTEVVLDQLVQPGGHVTLMYRYRLPEGSGGSAASSDVRATVESAVTTISGCAEGDPRVTKALESLRPLDQSQVVRELASYLNSSQPTIRRAAIYILWKGGFANVSPAAADLEKLVSHDEDLTRGMAALALGQNHVRESFDALAKMTREDQSGYARRCAAYALGLLGDARAEPVLKAAMTDPAAMVRNNAKAALAMLKSSSSTPEAATIEIGPSAVVAQKIRSEIARQLKEAGATYDDLQVTVAEERDSSKPFAVIYKGLRNFKYTRGGKPDPGWPASANGQFIMNYTGDGQWQGKLGDTQFTVQVGRTDNIDLPFVNDPQVIGDWKSVDFVANKSSFDPDKRRWKGELYLKGLTFREDGKLTPPRWTWTKGVLLDQGNKTASRYEIREIKGRTYLFLEWKSGDVTIAGMKPHYYVLQKKEGQTATTSLQLLNDDQRAVLEWTDRRFRSFFDERDFAGWSEKERSDLELRSIDALKGPRTREYYQAINTLAALHSTKALPALRGIAYDRAEKDNRDRWMAIRAIGMLGDKADVPEVIPLVYHGNLNTRWWAQISLVRLTGQNFGKDWNAWGKWWNDQNGQPPYKPEIIRWWSGQAEPGKLAESLNESDVKFLNSIKPQASASKEVQKRDEARGGEQYLQQQLKLAEAGNYWAKFHLWEAFSKGEHDVYKNPAEADKWLSEMVKGAYLAKFEPVNGFNPKTPQEMLDNFGKYCRLFSGRNSLGGASFFRTAKQDDKLIGSFLTATPDKFKAAIEQNPSLKLISIEKLTPEMFLQHEAAKQESL